MTEEIVLQIINASNNLEKQKNQKAFEEMALRIKIAFREEEAFYERHQHPDTIQHMKIHNEMERSMFSFEQTYFVENKKTESLLKEFCLYVRDWTTLHFEFYDKGMMSFIRINDYVQGAA